jgi:DNA-binding NtrC family response regulator
MEPILLVEDKAELRAMLRKALERAGYTVEEAPDGTSAIEKVRVRRYLLVLSDLKLPGSSGLDVLRESRKVEATLPVILMTAYGSVEEAVTAMKEGAFDFIQKPVDLDHLKLLLQRAAQQQELLRENLLLREEYAVRYGFPRIVGEHPAMKDASSMTQRVAATDSTVLLLGESGTGKEVLARLIHKLSPRAHRTFLKVNCAAVPADLLESELFGYEPGAFTGATHAKPGKFELCNKGTILLDEIGEMPPALQAKLLHVLQDQSFSRLGSRSVIKVDVRILAATNIDIPQALATKRLREDLYYRLNAFTLQLPPLRERKEEIPVLLKHFMTRMAERYARPQLPLSPAMLAACQAHPWPGNLRELNNFLKRYLILGDENLAVAELQPRNDGNGGMRGDSGTKTGETGGLKSLARNAKDEAEGEAIRQALEQTNWNRKQAAALLQISYKALLYKIRRYGIAEAKSHHKLSAGA